jgi:penicillin amidase
MGQYVKSPPTNLVCADVEGNIAFQVTAAAPDRPNWDGRLPVPGTGEYEWRGLRPSDDLPREYNPERNYIATANNNIHPPGWERPLFFDKQPPYWRVDRISQLIEAGKDYVPRDLIAMLRDNYRGAAAEWQPYFAKWRDADPRIDAARQAVADWDGFMTRDSAGAAVFHVWVEQIDPDAIRKAAPRRARALVRDALLNTVQVLVETQGADVERWLYGPLHTSVFAHPLVSAYDLPSMERDGGHETVNATGSVYRLVTDFSDLDNSQFTLAPGQSGQPGSPHYSDLLERWTNGDFFPLHYTREAVQKNARNRLSLSPQQPAAAPR